MKYHQIGFISLALIGIILPLVGVYPTFLMQCWCFALFACAYNVLLGYGGLTSFGHAAFFGGAAYITGHCVKVLGFPPERAFSAVRHLPPDWVSSLVPSQSGDRASISR